MPDRPATVTEQDVIDALGAIAATAHTLTGWVREARPVMEQLAEDYPPAAVLLQSLELAGAQPPHLGTPRHLEQIAAEILRDLKA